jgi:hypothetical protein
MKHITGYLLLALLTTNAYATNNSQFQAFDNQFAVGLGFQSSQTYNPNTSLSGITTSSAQLGLRIEQLFANNLWFNAEGRFAVSARQSQDTAGFDFLNQTLGFPASITGKVGYSFNFPTLDFQVIPYLSLGRSLNYNGIAISTTGFSNSYLNLFGGGVRAEYLINRYLSVYADELAGYLQDPIASEYNQSATTFNSRVGVRYNLNRYFQLSLEGMLTQSYWQNPNFNFDPVTLSQLNTAQTSYGGMLNFAYLFANSGAPADATPTRYHQSRIANFENNYSFGLGFSQVSNNYLGSTNPAVKTNLSYYNFSITHLFLNQIWANINAQLINSINQTNQPTSLSAQFVPTYQGFPGNVEANAGYAFNWGTDQFALIPYLNGGLVMNLNNYTLRASSGSLISAIANSRYLEYGAGVRAEYSPLQLLAVYGDYRLANLNDQSALKSNAWQSTATLGLKINPVPSFQVGIKGFYDQINPYGNLPNRSQGYALQQNSLGTQVDFGINY